MDNDTATLSNQGNMTVFQYGEQVIRFRAPNILEKYVEIKLWDHGYIEVLTLYRGIGVQEEYIDLIPVLQNLYIDPDKFLAPIKHLKLAES